MYIIELCTSYRYVCHLEFSFEQDVECVASVAFLDQNFPFLELPRSEGIRESLKIIFVQARKEVHKIKSLPFALFRSVRQCSKSRLKGFLVQPKKPGRFRSGISGCCSRTNVQQTQLAKRITLACFSYSLVINFKLNFPIGDNIKVIPLFTLVDDSDALRHFYLFESFDQSIQLTGSHIFRKETSFQSCVNEIYIFFGLLIDGRDKVLVVVVKLDTENVLKLCRLFGFLSFLTAVSIGACSLSEMLSVLLDSLFVTFH